MTTTAFTSNVTVVQAAWLNDADTLVYSYLTSVAGTNTITATGPSSLTAYAAGQKFHFLPAGTNTGATTLAITGATALAAKNVFWNGAACAGGEIKSGVPCVVEYDGTQFNIIGPFNGGTIAGKMLSANATGGIGYATGAGGAVAQASSRTTAVTLNTVTGAITLVSAAGTASWQTFTVNNSAVAATDTIIVNQKSGTDLNQIHVTAVGAGSFNISFATTGGTTTEQPVFNFSVIKGVAA